MLILPPFHCSSWFGLYAQESFSNPFYKAFILFSILSHHATTFSVTFYFKTIALNVYAFWIVHLKKHLENICGFFFFFPFLTEGNEQSSFNSSCLICSRITALLAELPTMRMDSTGHSSIYKALLELVSSRQN